MPEWSTRWFLIAAGIGFPFWLVFAWFYEFTSHGLQRESELARDPARAHTAARKLDFAIIAVLTIAVVLLLTNTFVWRRGAGLQSDDLDFAKVPPRSVAVLPLVNESGDPQQDYFSDGLSEELISDLTQIKGLKVIGKTSSFRFRHSEDAPAQIGAALGVANLIEGSVRQSGQRLRIVVDMIRAQDGTSVWSHTFERDLKDVFAIQSEIGGAVAAALKIRLLGKPIASQERPPSGNILAYQAFLQGTAVVGRGTEDAYKQGISLLRKATRIDPGYAQAYCVLSGYLINYGADFLTGAARQQAYAEARTAVDKALALSPGQAATHAAHGYVLANIDLDQMAALAEYQRAYALEPDSLRGQTYLANQLAIVGRLRQSLDLWNKALVRDPLRPDWYAVISGELTALGRFEDAEGAIRKALALQPDHPGLYQGLVVIDVLRGDAAAAKRHAAQETDPLYKALASAQAAQLSDDRQHADTALHDYLAKFGGAQPYLVAELYAVRGDAASVFKWLERARVQGDPNLVSLLDDPLTLRFAHDPRFAALCAELGLPVPAGASLAAGRNAASVPSPAGPPP